MALFKEAVRNTSCISGCYREGLSALRKSDKKRIRCRNNRSLTGSINIDECLKSNFPHDPRWDYGVGEDTEKGEIVHWIEIHPASSTHIGEILKKLNWLLSWLQSAAPILKGMPSRYIWISTGSISLRPGTPQMYRIAQAGIHFAGSCYTIK